MCVVTHQESAVDWERMWAPYDEETYQEVLAHIGPDDVVLDIGAGDLRLARRMAAQCRKVYAIEIQEALLNRSIEEKKSRSSDNLVVILGDALELPFPTGITVGVLLMRHCTHFQTYAEKLRGTGAERLITNARWRMGVEVVNLAAERIPFERLELGWYTCWCGEVGFKPGPTDRLFPEIITVTHEVNNCPQCLIRDRRKI